MSQDRPDAATPAGRRWQQMALAHRAQSERLRDPAWESGTDFRPTFVESFRAGRSRQDDAAVVEILRPHLRPTDTLVDVGAGAGRFALPLAAAVREVVAVEPSPIMGETLTEDARARGIANVRLMPSRWQELPDLRGDAVFSSHTVYPFLDIEPFVRWMSGAARRWAAIALFAVPPQAWIAPFWPLVHGEERLPAPHFPQLAAVLKDLGLGPIETTVIEVEPFPMGSPDGALARLRRRLYVVPGSEADRRLRSAMAELLEERDGVLVVRGSAPVTLGVARWRTAG
ncbi:MAG: methyltransferase domain-containing protein [Chloroflexi bacterium]|nr:methyltransferase domain-containing protein [Chloroflexota bacterium]